VILRKLTFFIICIILLTALVLSACDWEPGAGNNNYFEYRLQGTWETNSPSFNADFVTLEIDFDSITITIDDYYVWPGDRDDPRRPFKDFTKNFPLKGYSEKIDNNSGIIYIEDFGVLYEVPYQYNSSYNSSFDMVEILRFDFPSPDANIKRPEILKKLP